jgi:hypothetical protein
MPPIPPLVSRAHQRGVSLIFALITMGALSLAAVALIRSVDTGALVLGNLGFKQDTLQGADDASRAALTWLTNNIADARIQRNWADMAYYATESNPTANPLDVTGTGGNDNATFVDWAGDSCGGKSNCLRTREVTALSNGITARYVILRLCNMEGDPMDTTIAIRCARPLVNGAAGSTERGTPDFSNPTRIDTVTVSQYYRILVRARGGRDTLTFTETLVHF